MSHGPRSPLTSPGQGFTPDQSPREEPRSPRRGRTALLTRTRLCFYFVNVGRRRGMWARGRLPVLGLMQTRFFPAAVRMASRGRVHLLVTALGTSGTQCEDEAGSGTGAEVGVHPGSSPLAGGVTSHSGTCRGSNGHVRTLGRPAARVPVGRRARGGATSKTRWLSLVYSRIVAQR